MYQHECGTREQVSAAFPITARDEVQQLSLEWNDGNVVSILEQGPPIEGGLDAENDVQHHHGSMTPPQDGWTVVPAGGRKPAGHVVHTRLGALGPSPRQFFPNWFEYCDAEDRVGPVPSDRTIVVHTSDAVPILPYVDHSDKSFVDEFWSEINQSYNLYQRECKLCDNTINRPMYRLPSIRAAAVLVEVCEVTDEEDFVVEGTSTNADKGKALPRTDTQREFLERFASEKPSSSSTPRKTHQTTRNQRKHGKKTRERSKQTHKGSKINLFKREASQLPDGGWFRATTASAGGRGPPSSSSSSSSPSDSSNSSSDSSSDTSAHSGVSDSSSSYIMRSSSYKRHRKKQKAEQKRQRKALSGVKIKPPFVMERCSQP